MLTEKVSKLAVIANIDIGIAMICRFFVERINWSPMENNKILEIKLDHCNRICTIHLPRVKPIIGKIICNIAVHKERIKRCFTLGRSK